MNTDKGTGTGGARGVMMDHRKILAASGVLAPPIYFFTIAFVGLVRPHYNFVVQFISQLTDRGAPYQHLVIGDFVAFNALTLLFAIRLFELVRDVGRRRWLGYAGPILLVVQAIAGTLRSVIFHMDPIWAPSTNFGLVHLGLAGLGSITAVSILFVFGIWFRRVALPFHLGVYTIISGWVLLCAVIATAFSAYAGAFWQGLSEKVGVFAFIQWMFVLAVNLMWTPESDTRTSHS